MKKGYLIAIDLDGTLIQGFDNYDKLSFEKAGAPPAFFIMKKPFNIISLRRIPTPARGMTVRLRICY